MSDTTPDLTAQSRLHATLKQAWDVDFLRAKFNVSTKDVEKAISYAGNSREKLIEYFRKFFSGK